MSESCVSAGENEPDDERRYVARLYDATFAREVLQCARTRFWKLVHDGTIESVAVRGTRRFTWEQIDRASRSSMFPEALMSPERLAEYLFVSRRTGYRMIAEHDVPSREIEGRVFVHPSDVYDYVKRQSKR